MSNINNLTPEEFKKLLDGLLKEAEEHAGVVAKQDVDDVFADYRLKEEQKKLQDLPLQVLYLICQLRVQLAYFTTL